RRGVRRDRGAGGKAGGVRTTVSTSSGLGRSQRQRFGTTTSSAPTSARKTSQISQLQTPAIVFTVWLTAVSSITITGRTSTAATITGRLKNRSTRAARVSISQTFDVQRRLPGGFYIVVNALRRARGREALTPPPAR